MSDRVKIEVTKELIELLKKYRQMYISHGRIGFREGYGSKVEINYKITNDKVFLDDYNATISQLVSAGAIKENDEITVSSRINNNDAIDCARMNQHQLVLMVVRKNKIVLNDILLYSNAIPSTMKSPYQLY